MRNNAIAVGKDGTLKGYTADGQLVTPDGVREIDPAEIAFLFAYDPEGLDIVTPPAEDGITFPAVEMGSRGMTVLLVQTALKARGCYDGKIDGDFGVLTHGGLRRFMQRENIPGDTAATEEVLKKLFAED